tara:strand:+ start:49782 stop:51080 length:1299 start_codon:yes stop_codon:yes gene_type:complete
MVEPRSLKINKNKLILSFIISAFVGGAISYSDFYLFHFVLLTLSIIWIYQIKENEFRLDIDLFSKNHVFPLIIILLWYLISLLWTPSIELGLKYIFYIFCGISITLSIISFCSNVVNLNKIFYMLSIFIFIEIIIGLIESFTSFRMPISSYSSLAPLFGKDPINFSEFDTIFLYSGIRPPTGFRWNTNDLAISMIISLPFFICNKRKLIKVFGILSITTIVIMTASRAAFLAMLLIYSFYLFFVKKRVGTLSLIIMTSVGILWSMFQLRESENPRINELANSIEALTLFLSGQLDVGGSIEWRRELVDNGINAFYNSFGLGIGAGGSVSNQEIIGPVAGRFTSMHNFWIELLVEGGIFIAIIISFGILSIIYKLFIISRTTPDNELKYFSQSLFLSVTAFIPAAIAASSTIYFFPMWIMFGFAISVILLSKA